MGRGGNTQFAEETRADGVRALERWFKRKVEWGEGVESNMLCEMIWRFG